METPPHCTVSLRTRRPPWLWLLALTFGVLVVHGYHPWAEDGGLYLAGVEYTLDPSLFPRDTAFVTEHLRYSCFAPVMAALVRLSHLSLAAIVFLTYLLSTFTLLLAADRLAARCFPLCRLAQRTAVALLAAWWTLPIAGTSLLLMDPYVTARSFSTPLSLLAVAAASEAWEPRGRLRSAWLARLVSTPALTCALCLILAGLVHPLMAFYACSFVVLLRLSRARKPLWVWAGVATAPLLAGVLLQSVAAPETPAGIAAVLSRYYWFLSEWQWYEWLGLLGPLAIFIALLRQRKQQFTDDGRALCRAALALGLLAFVTAALFAHEHARVYAVARLQPLRCYLLLYAVMSPLLGGWLANVAQPWKVQQSPTIFRPLLRILPAFVVVSTALVMFFVQRLTFPGSIHLELPGRTNPNLWVQAFVWAKEHTPPDALFALDARYINTAGEDAQTFRAIALRSAVPDFSKDGGEAAITPSLAATWQRSATATQDLSGLSDVDRDAHLRALGVQWMMLHADAPTAHPCPYRNAVLKVCRVQLSH